MSRLNKCVILLALCLVSVIGHARIFKHVNPLTGSITYSNFPLRGQESEATPAPKKAVQRNAAPAVATPASFPKVAAATQKERDSDRQKILNDELQSEQNALNDAIAKNASDDMIQRHKANIAALQREIGNTK